jgi:hypothetical protein
MPKAKDNYELEVAVTFKGVSVGKGTGRISFSVDRNNMDIEKAEQFFCGRRLTGFLVAVRPKDEDPDQQVMFDESHKLEGSFDLKQFACKPQEFTSSASFVLSEITFADLEFFSNRCGQLRVVSNDELDHEAVGEDDPEE